MGLISSRLKRPPRLGDLDDTVDDDLFKDHIRRVSLTSWIHNSTPYNLSYLGSYINKGVIVEDCNDIVKPEVEAGSREVAMATVNTELRRDFFRGVSGVGVWQIKGSNFCLVVAWRIPRFHMLTMKTNTMAVCQPSSNHNLYP